jgi:hypothetical protein
VIFLTYFTFIFCILYNLPKLSDLVYYTNLLPFAAIRYQIIDLCNFTKTYVRIIYKYSNININISIALYRYSSIDCIISILQYRFRSPSVYYTFCILYHLYIIPSMALVYYTLAYIIPNSVFVYYTVCILYLLVYYTAGIPWYIIRFV